jgi:8-oxo-dGTP diphosphatase
VILSTKASAARCSKKTGIEVQVERLTGVYKNMPRGIVSLVFRCAPVGGQPTPTDEALSVRWLSIEEIRHRMDPAYVVRVTDAFADRASARVHDGVNLVYV